MDSIYWACTRLALIAIVCPLFHCKKCYRQEKKPEEGMFCKLCQKYSKSTKRMVFITSPCVLFRKDKLHEHQKTLGHANSIIAELHAVAANF